MLRCIRCGACMNHCVVYRQIGGHAYGGAYPGPMGSVLTPVFDGLAKSRDLPHACTLNGKCAEVCPVADPLALAPARLAGSKLARRPGAECCACGRRGLGLRRAPAQPTGWQRRYRSNGCASFARAAGSRACPLPGDGPGIEISPRPSVRHLFRLIRPESGARNEQRASTDFKRGGEGASRKEAGCHSNRGGGTPFHRRS